MTARTTARRIEDVRSLQAAARAVVEQRATLVPAIVESTGLSSEGVAFALARCLELEATEADLEALVERAGDAARVSVVLSANVFVGAFRALAIARAASMEVVVRPSRRDPAFARALVEAAVAAGDRCLRLDESLEIASIDAGEIHVYGRDDTIADVQKHAKVRVRGHGSGMGVAWISEGADLASAARGLAEDVAVFDQRGCLSPRIALVQGDEARAAELADRLHAELDRLEEAVPRGDVPADERAAAARYVATMTYACRVLVGSAHAIGIAPPGAPLVLPPPYRHVHLAACASVEDAARLLQPLARGIVTVGTDAPGAARALVPSWARLAALGRMQRPPLDGPVDLREG
jgi:acyl-CoA reductase-like NAD-dependent aldehyde dehydrogenase